MPASSLESLSDEALMARVAVAETEALAILIQRYRKRVYGMVFRVVGKSSEADDLFQETWIRVARRAPTFDPRRRFAPWLAAIATHVAIDWTRTHGNKPLQHDDPALESKAAASPDPEQELAAAERRDKVRAALTTLPQPLKEAVLLRYFQELSEAEMASSLGVPKGTVKSRLHNALKSLRARLGETPDAAR